SAKVAHDTRWELPLPSRADTVSHLRRVRDQVLEALERGPADEYFVRLSVFHEDMHDEALTYTRQTLAYPPPRLDVPAAAPANRGPWPGDVMVRGGRFLLGAVEGADRFVFDNEKWVHPIELEDFRIARAAVTQAEFAAFVEATRRPPPLYWRRSGRDWERRV